MSTSGQASSTPGALKGVKVIEMGQLIAGPFAGKTLGEFGADVIKIEPPTGGDPLRNWRLIKDGTSVWWQVQSRNKRSIALDLRIPGGQEIARKLIAEADVLIENFRPGTLEQWGLGYEALAELNPGLVMLRISGYGQTGPYRDLPGFGAIGEAMGGLRHLTGEPGRVPVRCGISIGDTLAALHGTIGILIALYHRKVNGGRGSGHRRCAQRSSVQCHGEPDSRVQRLRRRSRGGGQRAAWHRAIERVSLHRRFRPYRRQWRQHLQAVDGNDRPRTTSRPMPRSRATPAASRGSPNWTKRSRRGHKAVRSARCSTFLERHECRRERSTRQKISMRTRTTAPAT